MRHSERSTGDVHEGEARAESEGDIVGFRAIHGKGRLHEWGRVGFFVHANEQTILAIFVDHTVGDAVVAAESGEASEIFIELRGLERFAYKSAEEILDVAGIFRADAFDANELGRADGRVETARIFDADTPPNRRRSARRLSGLEPFPRRLCSLAGKADSTWHSPWYRNLRHGQ